MPRIHPSVFAKARSINKALLSLLPVCRDLSSAQNEFRWMKEHAVSVTRQIGQAEHRDVFAGFLKRRASGEPLQYILGSEYFGDLEIKCRPGVLIPRQETATSVAHLASLIASDHNLVQDEQPRLRILDLCTGTGCIPLLFHNQFYSANPSTSTLLELVGVDISADALSLARENLIHQIANAARQRTGPPKRTKSLNQIGFVQANVLASGSSSETSSEIVSGGSLPLTEALERLYGNSDPPTFDVLISNPPYVSPRSYLRTTSRSVRDFEPKLALVPSRPTSEDDTSTGDYFYPRLWQAAADVNAKVCLFEVAGLEQATRVAGMALQRSVWDVVEIWRDDPRGRGEAMEEVIIAGQSVRVRGDGNGRSVFVRRTRSGA